MPSAMASYLATSGADLQDEAACALALHRATVGVGRLFTNTEIARDLTEAMRSARTIALAPVEQRRAA